VIAGHGIFGGSGGMDIPGRAGIGGNGGIGPLEDQNHVFKK